MFPFCHEVSVPHTVERVSLFLFIGRVWESGWSTWWRYRISSELQCRPLWFWNCCWLNHHQVFRLVSSVFPVVYLWGSEQVERQALIDIVNRMNYQKAFVSTGCTCTYVAWDPHLQFSLPLLLSLEVALSVLKLPQLISCERYRFRYPHWMQTSQISVCLEDVP